MRTLAAYAVAILVAMALYAGAFAILGSAVAAMFFTLFVAALVAPFGKES